MQLSVAQRVEGLNVIKVDAGHLIHFSFDDLRVQSGTMPRHAILGPTPEKLGADKVRISLAAGDRLQLAASPRLSR